VRGLMNMMDCEGFVGPVNIGNPGEFTILQLAEKIVELTDSKSVIVLQPLPEDDPTRRRPDISLANQKLDWSPTVKLEQGLEKTIAYFASVI